MSNHAELFNGLLEAGKALEELPQVKAELEYVKSDLDLTNNLLESVQQDLNSRDAEIARLKADLATREAELASATFREAEVQATLDGVRKLLGGGNADVAGAGNEVMGQTQAVESPTPIEAAHGADAVGSEPKRDETFHDPDKSEWPIPASLDSTGPLSGHDSQATTYGVVDEAGRFVSHDPEPEVAPQSEPVRPFLNRPHWQKPGSLTWGEWVGKGGLTPTWYDSRYDEFKTT